MTDTPEQRLAALGITLPPPAAPAAAYVPAVRVGELLFISGQLPMSAGGLAFAGKLGAGVDIATGREAAQLCAINILAQVRAALGELRRVARVVRLTGYVNGAPDFTEPHKVVDGASELMVAVFGEHGRHSRATMTVASLPVGAAVEIDAVIAIRE